MPIIDLGENPDAPQAKEMVDLEATLEKLENEVKVVNKNAEELKRTYLNLTELHFMLKKTQQFFDEVRFVLSPFSGSSLILGLPCQRCHCPP